MDTTIDKKGLEIQHDLTISAPIEKVYDAVSQPDHLKNWWPLKCTGVPKLNEEYNFYFGPEYNWYGKVSKIEDEKSFFIKMTKSDEDWDPTTFGFDMEKREGTVYLRFRHSGWPHLNDHFKTSSQCWADLLNGLKAYIEKGEIIPFENRS